MAVSLRAADEISVTAVSNAGTKTAARSALGAAIGSNVQAWSSNLDGWSSIPPASIQAQTNSAASRILFYENEFLLPTAVGDYNLTSSALNSGSVTASNAIPNHTGLVALNTLAPTTGGGAITGSGTSVQFGNGVTSCEWLIQAPSALSDGTDTYTIYAGFSDASSTSPVDGAFFVYNHTQDTHWQFTTCTNTTGVNRQASSVTFTVNVWYKLDVVVNAAGAPSRDVRVSIALNAERGASAPTAMQRSSRQLASAVRRALS